MALQFRDTIAKLHTVNRVLGHMWHYNFVSRLQRYIRSIVGQTKKNVVKRDNPLDLGSRGCSTIQNNINTPKLKRQENVPKISM